MKCAIITDQHFGARKGSKIFHDYFGKFYNDIFFPVLEREDIKYVVDMGDTFDNRKSIDFWSLEWAKKNYYDKLQNLGITVYTVIGNHTTYYKNTNSLNSIETLLSEYENVIPISEPEDIVIGNLGCLMIPWINSDNYETSMNKINSSPSIVAMGHLELNGFSAYRGHIHESGMDPSVFSKFAKVFSGHYHTRSDDGKIYYLGNPYEIYWNDYKDVRGFHLFDTKTLETTSINNPYNIFTKIEYNDTPIDKINFEYYSNKIVKLIVTKKSNQQDFDLFLDNLYKSGVHELKIIENFDFNVESTFEETEKSEDTVTILENYIESMESNFNKSKIKNIIHDVYKTACEVI